jgi:N-acetylglucosamine kinase-like BadF-type ATPase
VLAAHAGAGGREWLRLLSVCAGLAGVDTEADVVSLTGVLREAFGDARLRVVNDGEIALEGALDGEPGVLVISGTGSIVWACGRGGRRVRVGGWDYVLSDEGSGYHIGTLVLRAVAAAHDRRTPPTALAEEVYRALGVSCFDEMLEVVYEERLTPQTIASLAPLADAAASSPRSAAAKLLNETAAELADLTEAAARLAGLSDGTRFPVVPSGGVLLAGGYFSQRFRALVSERLPDAFTSEARHTPAEGAVRLALRALSPTAAGAARLT